MSSDASTPTAVGPTREQLLADLATDVEDGEDAPAGFDLDVPEFEENRPALQTLGGQQRALIAAALDGFSDRADVIRWARAVALHSLGEVRVEWLQDRLFSRFDMAVLCGPEWLPDHADPLPERKRKAARRGLVAIAIHPAFIAAQTRMRRLSVSYRFEDVPARPSSDGQKHPAMRPLLSELNDRQTWAVDRLLGGFGDLDAFLRWSMEVVEASFAEADPALADRVLARHPEAGRYLTAPQEDTAARVFRQNIAVDLLGAFSAAASEAVSSAVEVSEQEVGHVGHQSIE